MIQKLYTISTAIEIFGGRT